MSSPAHRADVEDFLTSFCAMLRTFGLVFVSRRKNLAALNQAGLSIRDAEQVVLGLSPTD